MAAVNPRMILYEQLCQLSAALERVIPDQGTWGRDLPWWDTHRKFCPCTDMILEARPEGIWRLSIDPTHWQWRPTRQQGARATRFSLRTQARQNTQHASAWNDQISVGPPPPIPPGVRLWQASGTARRLLVHAKHDLRELFQSQNGINNCPSCEGTLTLLITPTRMLGFKDAITLIRDGSPYLTRICLEYAQMVCWLYGLRMDEFATLTQMCISRRLGGTAISLQRKCGGFYDNGPVVTMGIGHPYIYHDFSPTLMDHTDAVIGPIRIQVGEGVMTVMDAHARVSYAHGYSAEPAEGGGSPYYTIDFHMDCMRNTRVIGHTNGTGDMLMYSPVMDTNTVQTEHTFTPKGAPVEGICPLLDLVRNMRQRVHTRESMILLDKFTVDPPHHEQGGDM